MKTINKYDILQWLALFITPIAPAFAFGWRVYSFAMELSGLWWLSVPVGISGAIGLEVMGIYSGHVMLEAWRQKKDKQRNLAIAGMLVYMGVGIYELWGTILMSLFLVAGLVYVVVAINETLQADNVLHEENVASKIKDRELDRQAMREAREAQQRLDHKLALERIRAESKAKIAIAKASYKPAIAISEPATSQLPVASELAVTCDCGWTGGSKQAKAAHHAFCALNPNARARKNGKVPALNGAGGAK